MFRKLQLPYSTLSKLWEADFNDDNRTKYFGLNNRGDPDFLKENIVASAKYFGSYNVKEEIKDPNEALKHLFNLMEKNGDKEKIQTVRNIVNLDDIGRYYDNSNRIYMRKTAKKDLTSDIEEWFVRLPQKQLDAWNERSDETIEYGFPIIGSIIVLKRRNESINYIVEDNGDYDDNSKNSRIATCFVKLRKIQ